MSENVHQIADHPQRIRELVESLTRDLSCVDFSANLNELLQGRKVSMQAIWCVLETGIILDEYTSRNENGLYLKMYDAVAGIHIYVDLVIEPGDQRLVVLWAEEEED